MPRPRPMRDVLAELGPVLILAMFALISAASKLLRSAKNHSFFAIRKAFTEGNSCRGSPRLSPGSRTQATAHKRLLELAPIYVIAVYEPRRGGKSAVLRLSSPMQRRSMLIYVNHVYHSSSDWWLVQEDHRHDNRCARRLGQPRRCLRSRRFVRCLDPKRPVEGSILDGC
jgi:hypothetical protein